MKRLRVVLLTHEDLVPPEGRSEFKALDAERRAEIQTEFDVCEALHALGHDVHVLGVSDDLLPIRRVVEGWEAQVVFNLLMEFQDVGAFQAHVVSYLELLGVPFTGCNSLGIQLSRDKALSKKVLRYHRIPTPRFAMFPRGRKPEPRRRLRFPVIVKSVDEEASLGISQASVVQDAEKLLERAAFMHERFGTDAIAEEYVEGRELTVSVIGNDRLRTLPVWELFFDKLPDGSLPIATRRVKWDQKYQKRVGIRTGPAADLPAGVAGRIDRMAKRVYRELGLSGYARLDLRLTAQDEIYVIEANATPDVSEEEDFALSAKAAGLAYPQLVQRLVTLGRSYRPAWKS